MTLSQARRLRRRPLTVVLLMVGSLLPGCREAAPGARSGETISEDAFVAAYVDLRVEALTAISGELSPEARTVVLQAHALTEDDLVGFVELHGSRVGYMRTVWDRIDARLTEVRDSLRVGDAS